MIMDELDRIYTCEHKKRIKKKQRYKHNGYSVYICSECEDYKEVEK